MNVGDDAPHALGAELALTQYFWALPAVRAQQLLIGNGLAIALALGALGKLIWSVIFFLLFV